jgi:hypothetical protein
LVPVAKPQHFVSKTTSRYLEVYNCARNFSAKSADKVVKILLDFKSCHLVGFPLCGLGINGVANLVLRECN